MCARMGTHINGPARRMDNKMLLSDWLRQNSASVGAVPANYATDDLPFMLKVLTIQSALSIQVMLISLTLPNLD